MRSAVGDGKIGDAAFTGVGAISQASISRMIDLVKERASRRRAISPTFHPSMIKGKELTDELEPDQPPRRKYPSTMPAQQSSAPLVAHAGYGAWC